jgi:long-chain fatty acid transport protein
MKSTNLALAACFVTNSLLLSSPRDSRAAGFAAARFGGEHGTVVTTNPTALYFNPAGIGFSKGTHIFVDGTLAMRRASWDHPLTPDDPVDPMGAEGQGTGKATLSNVFGGPMLGATTKLGDLAFGASLSVPFGGRASWDKNIRFENHPQYPLAGDGIQRWHGIEGALTFIYLTAGAAYRIGPLSIGASGNLVLSSVKSLQAKGFANTGKPEPDSEGRADLDVSGTHGSFAVGGMFEAMPDRLWIGASYQAQPGLGPQVLTGTVTNTYLGSGAPYPVKFHQALPDIVRLGARFRPTETLELRLFGDFTRWSVMKTQCVVLDQKDFQCVVNPDGSDASVGNDGTRSGVLQNLRRRWKDTFGIRAGVSHWVVPAVELFAGAGYETAASPDETLDPAIGDANSVAVALGGRFAIMPSLFVAGSYTNLHFIDRNNIGRSETAKPIFPTARAAGDGRYSQWIGLFNANVEFVF